MHLDWIRSFLAVVDERGFAAAAEATHRAQSRISSHVGSLERELGTILFDRRARPVRLTDAGRAVAPHARAILDHVEESRSDIAALNGLQAGQVRIGTYPSISAGFLPALLSNFKASYPRVEVHLFEGTLGELDEALIDRRVDISFRPMLPSPTSKDLVGSILWREKHLAVLAKDHALANHSEALTRSDLAGHDLITSRTTLEGLRAEGRQIFRTDNPQALIEFARNGLGVGVTNQLALTVSHLDLHDLVVRDIVDPPAFRDVGLWWNESSYRTTAARELLRMIRNASPPSGLTKMLEPDTDDKP